MLQNLRGEIRDCYQRADACARKAKAAFDDGTRQDFMRLQRSWLDLAHGYELAEQLLEFTVENKRKSDKRRGPQRGSFWQ
jgi:hypothetical protein